MRNKIQNTKIKKECYEMKKEERMNKNGIIKW